MFDQIMIPEGKVGPQWVWIFTRKRENLWQFLKSYISREAATCVETSSDSGDYSLSKLWSPGEGYGLSGREVGFLHWNKKRIIKKSYSQKTEIKKGFNVLFKNLLRKKLNKMIYTVLKCLDILNLML